jgi:FkbM family methyltransferase
MKIGMNNQALDQEISAGQLIEGQSIDQLNTLLAERERQVRMLIAAMGERDRQLEQTSHLLRASGNALGWAKAAASAPFFPNQPAQILELEMLYRREVEKLPQASRLVMYAIFSSILPGMTTTSFRLADGMVIAGQGGREIAFPDPLPMIKYSHIVFGYEQWLLRKYCLPGFVEVEAGDIVVDCGGFVGGFSLSAAKVASQVHIFEPEHLNFRCIKQNFAGIGNVVMNQAGLYSETRTMRLNISTSGVEHSLLAPDDGVVVQVKEIQVIALRDYLLSRNLPRFDFVKIEAEGVELEVFDGLRDCLPRKLAIDVSPERDGQSPFEAFRSKLSQLGYEMQLRGHVLFARRPI